MKLICAIVFLASGALAGTNGISTNASLYHDVTNYRGAVTRRTNDLPPVYRYTYKPAPAPVPAPEVERPEKREVNSGKRYWADRRISGLPIGWADAKPAGRMTAEPMAAPSSEIESPRVEVKYPRRFSSAAPGLAIPSVIESRVDGEFDGWEDETIVKLMNGQIWQQTQYHYEYHYAYMPDVLIYRSREGWKMKVEGTREAVRVERLK